MIVCRLPGVNEFAAQRPFQGPIAAGYSGRLPAATRLGLRPASP